MNNSTPSPPSERSEFIRTIVPVMMLCCVFALCVNLVVLLAAKSIPARKWTPTLLLTLSLAGSDTWLATLLGLGLLYNNYLPTVFNVHFPLHWCGSFTLEGFRLGSLGTSVLHLAALANSQLNACRARYIHRGQVHGRRYRLWKLLILGIWTLPPSFFFAIFSFVKGEGFRHSKCHMGGFFRGVGFRIMVGTTIILPLPLMISAYARSIWQVRRKRSACQLTALARRIDRVLRTAITTLLIIFSFIIFIVPGLLLYVLVCESTCAVSISQSNKMLIFTASVIVNVFIIAKALTNPFLYAARIPEINQALRDIFNRRHNIGPTQTRALNAGEDTDDDSAMQMALVIALTTANVHLDPASDSSD